MLKTVGRQAEGIAAYRKAIALKPTLGEAWWSLANLKTVKFDDADIAAMERRWPRPGLTDEDRFHLDFALGKAMHDAGRPTTRSPLFEGECAAAQERALRCGGSSPRTVDRCIAAVHREAFAERDGGGCEARDPIFIVGMPRAGSTLIEQILASHSQVEGTSELPDIPACVARKAGAYPGGALKLGIRRSERERSARNISSAPGPAPHRPPFFIDKLPNNWLFVPFIQLILPNAKIIDARRHPLGCCLLQLPPAFRARPGRSPTTSSTSAVIMPTMCG
jgi:hypothetical protein